jgi:integrase
MAVHHFGRTRVDAALSATQRADARAALKLLAGSGFTLEAAARRAIEGRAALVRISVDDAAEMFLRAKLAKRGATWQWYETRLNGLRAQFGARFLDDVSRAEFRGWVAALEVEPSTRTGYVRAARALWRWAAAQEPPLAGPSPTAGMVASLPSKGGTVGFLSVAQAAQLLAVDSPWRAALALMLFAGVRVEEVAGQGKPAMLWRCVDVVGKSIRVPGECAKVTGRARLVQGLPPAVWAWLGKPGADDAPVSPGLGVCGMRWARRRVEGFPPNALRHTFATYAYALTGDAGKVAGWMGHEGEPRLVLSTYAGLARKAEAQAFFVLRPAKG